MVLGAEVINALEWFTHSTVLNVKWNSCWCILPLANVGLHLWYPILCSMRQKWVIERKNKQQWLKQDSSLLLSLIRQTKTGKTPRRGLCFTGPGFPFSTGLSLCCGRSLDSGKTICQVAFFSCGPFVFWLCLEHFKPYRKTLIFMRSNTFLLYGFWGFCFSKLF